MTSIAIIVTLLTIIEFAIGFYFGYSYCYKKFIKQRRSQEDAFLQAFAKIARGSGLDVEVHNIEIL